MIGKGSRLVLMIWINRLPLLLASAKHANSEPADDHSQVCCYWIPFLPIFFRIVVGRTSHAAPFPSLGKEDSF